MTGRTPQQDIDRVRNLISFVLVGSFVGALVDFTIFAVPPSNKDIITYMVGQLSGMALMALGFYFTNKVGQDAVDAKRAETTGKMADAIAAVATTTLPIPDADPQPVEIENPPSKPVPTTSKGAT